MMHAEIVYSGENISDWMVENGHARIYNGEKPWRKKDFDGL